MLTDRMEHKKFFMSNKIAEQIVYRWMFFPFMTHMMIKKWWVIETML